MATNGNLTPKQRRAIAFLLSEPSTKAAAVAAGIGYRTLCRWLEDETFRAALTQAEDVAIDGAVRRLTGEGLSAVNTLAGIMADPGNSPSVRLRAAGMILASLLDLRELRTTQERLAALEAIHANEHNPAA